MYVCARCCILGRCKGHRHADGSLVSPEDVKNGKSTVSWIHTVLLSIPYSAFMSYLFACLVPPSEEDGSPISLSKILGSMGITVGNYFVTNMGNHSTRIFPTLVCCALISLTPVPEALNICIGSVLAKRNSFRSNQGQFSSLLAQLRYNVTRLFR